MKRESSCMESKDKKFEKIKELIRSLDSMGKWVHVISHKNRWAVLREGASRADRIFTSKVDAITYAKSFLENGRATDVIIHKKDGTIENWEKLDDEEPQKVKRVPI
ncbi:DUF2188 domain-containing protein [Candidatus Poribacteria bacterium]|nr:DUF2188 domain-containing protein [Candidatus Poribacteria bacterium]